MRSWLSSWEVEVDAHIESVERRPRGIAGIVMRRCEGAKLANRWQNTVGHSCQGHSTFMQDRAMIYCR